MRFLCSETPRLGSPPKRQVANTGSPTDPSSIAVRVRNTGSAYRWLKWMAKNVLCSCALASIVSARSSSNTSGFSTNSGTPDSSSRMVGSK